MKILSSKQIRKADAYTIEHEPISSVDLMERAGSHLLAAITELALEQKVRPLESVPVRVLCGMGNNGGDGLVIARLLFMQNIDVQVIVTQFSKEGSEEFEVNLSKVKDFGIPVVELTQESELPVFNEEDLLLDSIFGSGLDRPIQGWLAELVKAVNQSRATVIAIDMPSGLQSEGYSDGTSDHVVHAKRTLTLEVPKLSLLFADNYEYVGEWQVVPIGLDQKFMEQLDSQYYLIDNDLIRSIVQPRPKVAHKGNFGHALIISGSYGKMGAAVLAMNACVRSGAGLTTGHIPRKGLGIMQISVPEAMCSTDPDKDHFTEVPDITAYNSIGIGPGIGQDPQTASALNYLIQNSDQPLVLDADALNILAENPAWIRSLPKNSILTPHQKEFERLVGVCNNDHQRVERATDLARSNAVHVLLKGAYTAICAPNGEVYFNATGNPGMASGGSGDVLTGIITGLLAQGYSSLNAALLGVYWHGKAGDKAAFIQGEASMKAGDIVECMGTAYLEMIKKE